MASARGACTRRILLRRAYLTRPDRRGGMKHANFFRMEWDMTPIRLVAVALAASVAVALAASFAVTPAAAQGTKVAIGISGWTGFAPLTLAKEAGIFAKNGLDVTIKKIPQASRHLAIASGDIQCAATTVETWIVWN